MADGWRRGHTQAALQAGAGSVLLRELEVLQLVLRPLRQLPELRGGQPHLCVQASICKQRRRLHKLSFIWKKPALGVPHH